jgi:hypothetical protein
MTAVDKLSLSVMQQTLKSYPNGDGLSLVVDALVEALEDGRYRVFDVNNTISEGHLNEEGAKTGVWETTLSNGNLVRKTYSTTGKNGGMFKEAVYDDKGEIIPKKVWIDNNLNLREEYTSAGELVDKCDFVRQGFKNNTGSIIGGIGNGVRSMLKALHLS